MAEPGAALERLRALAGIGRCFTDFRGQQHTLSERSLRALLAALGFDPGDETALAATAQEFEEREWNRVVPPVVVLHSGCALPFTVLVPLLPVIRWRVELEDGDTVAGEVAPAELPSIGERGVGGLWYRRLELPLPALPPGYHQLWLEKDDFSPLATTRLIVAPRRCHEPEVLRDGGRLWGPAIQLYTLRSRRNWGCGDFSDLGGFATAAAGLGADFLGLNPLHALFPADPELCAPYSPSSRYWLNIIYIDPEAIPEFAHSVEAQRLRAAPEFQARLAELRAVPEVDYSGVMACKLEILRLVHRDFMATASAARREACARFIAEGGEALERFALFHALQAHFTAAGRAGGWPAWPEPYHHPGGAAAQAFRDAEPEAVNFHAWLQWVAREQLDAAAAMARDRGLRLGLYQDLAVGPNAGGAETWSMPEIYALEASVGAPPDPLALQGQDWGIPPFHPEALRAAAYEPFIKLLRANMPRGGVLRIDHVMTLFRLWWVPRDGSSAEGGYVHYALQELIGILALESVRQGCLVVGEDLGTVPPEVRAAMSEYGVYSYRVLMFERDGTGAFHPPADYPRAALVTPATHDLPTIAGFWRGVDIDLRERLGLYPRPADVEHEREARREARICLLDALAREALVPADVAAREALSVGQVAAAVQQFLARSPSALLALQPEDWLGIETPVNVPGTCREYPNWRRKLNRDWEEFMDEPGLIDLVRAVDRARGSGDHGHFLSDKPL